MFDPISVNNKKVVIIAPIYNQIDKLDILHKMYMENTILIFTGDICYPNDDLVSVLNRIEKMDEFLKTHESYYILGDKDLIFLKENKNNDFLCQWINKQRAHLTLKFINSCMLTIVHGGISENVKSWSDLNNMEVCFVNNIDGFTWHKYYDGRFGYIISAHPSIENENLIFYNFSTSIDNLCYKNNKLCIQEYNNDGSIQTSFI